MGYDAAIRRTAFEIDRIQRTYGNDAFALLCIAVSLWLLARALLRGNPTMTPHPVPAGATI